MKLSILFSNRIINCDDKYVKIRFNWDDNLPLKQELEMHGVVITIWSVFYDNNKHCP